MACLILLALAFPLLGEDVHCDGTISVFFATPSDDTVDEALCKILQTASSTVDIAIYSFTLPNVADTLEALAEEGVRIRILMEDVAPGGNSVVCSLVRSSTNITMREVSEGRLFHHKFAVLNHSVVITGSFNWSDNAQGNNWENLNIIVCPDLAAAYTEQFESIWNFHSSPGCPPHPAKVNINTATKSELMELPGIGDSFSDRIIDYRNTHGNFSRIEDVMNVPYIAEGRFAQIKDLICVGVGGDCGN